ncbi:MAG: hypothetical protein ACE5GY_07005 [Thermodesulfobacteriota bacterium]
MAEKKENSGPQTKESEQGRRWWRLPFDTTTNFSIFGYFLGGFRCESPENRTVFTLEDE